MNEPGTKVLEWNCPPDAQGRIFQFPNGRKVTFSKVDNIFLEMLSEQPVAYRVAYMALTHRELIDYLESQRSEITEFLIINFKKKWQWNETGENYNFSDEYANDDLFGIEKTKKQILNKLKRGTESIDNLVKMKEFFETQTELDEV